MSEQLHPESRAIRAGRQANGSSFATPIFPSTTYELTSVEVSGAMATTPRSTEFYARNGTPTAQSFADAVADLEGAEAGLAFGSGMGAISTLVMAFCSPGDRIVAQSSMFSVTTQLMNQFCPRFGITVDYVDLFDAAELEAAVAAKPTQMVWAESPANPSLGIVDFEVLGRQAVPWTVVDSTMATPALQRPLDHGINFSVHSATKGIAGHNDALLGVLCGERELVDIVWGQHVLNGAVASPFDAFLGIRGIRSLHARVRQQCETAQAIAERLEGHAAIGSVIYPGLASHRHHALAMRQMKAGGTVVVIDLDGGLDVGIRFIERIALARPGLSLGGPETIITHPASMSAATLSTAERAAMGISDGMMRISVGLEHVDDLVDDLVQALGG